MLLEDLKIKLFADGADLAEMVEIKKNSMVKGFTTNPTLMRKSGITDYEGFAKLVLSEISELPVSFEVFADDFPTMIAQGRTIASWGKNVNVKVPVSDTRGNFSGEVIKTLSNDGVMLNVTAIMTPKQVAQVAANLNKDVPAIISVFAGRVADTGVDPVPLMEACKDELNGHPKSELLWASPRELLNIFQADECGCDIITATNDLIKKLQLVGKDLTEYSKETVQMFYRDATASRFMIRTI